jgi:hypothetical protein
MFLSSQLPRKIVVGTERLVVDCRKHQGMANGILEAIITVQLFCTLKLDDPGGCTVSNSGMA